MIKNWIVICDDCGKEIDATKEVFHILGDDIETHLCEECYNEM